MAVHSGLSRPSLRQLLQEATKDVHEALHHHPVLAPLGSPDLTLGQYVTIIKSFHSFYAEQEPFYKGIEPRFAQEVDPLQLLASDFARLGIEEVPAAQPVQSAPFASYLGYLYVKQGSTLGGQLIAKGLEKSLGLVRGKDQFFFYGAGPETGPNWKAFENFLSAHEEDADQDHVVASAQALFQSLYQHLNSHGKA